MQAIEMLDQEINDLTQAEKAAQETAAFAKARLDSIRRILNAKQDERILIAQGQLPLDPRPWPDAS